MSVWVGTSRNLADFRAQWVFFGAPRPKIFKKIFDGYYQCFSYLESVAEYKRYSAIARFYDSKTKKVFRMMVYKK